jgi:hypothetical protein
MDMPGVWDVVLLVGLSARVTRLVTVDTIMAPVRERAIYEAARRSASWDGGFWVASLLGCPHCVGFWLSLLVLASWLVWGGTTVWVTVAGAFTLSYVAGHLVGRLDMGDDDDAG